MNVSLLSKWWWRLEKEDGIWQRIIRAKYIKGELVSTVKSLWDDSPVWKDLMKIRHIYLAGRKIKVGDGSITLFWLDCWINDKPLHLLYPTLFELCEAKLITVKKFLEVGGNISFRRWLPPFLQEQWAEVIRSILPPPRSMSLDTVSWKWSTTGAFTVNNRDCQQYWRIFL